MTDAAGPGPADRRRARAILATGALVAVLAGLGFALDIRGGVPVSAPPATTVADPPPSAEPLGPGDGGGLVLNPIAQVPDAIGIATRPGSGDLYVAQRTGSIRRIARVTEDGRIVPRLVDGVVLDMRGEVAPAEGEEGLLDITFSPDGSHLFVSYVDRAGDSRLRQYAMSGDEADADRHWDVIEVDQPDTGLHRAGGLSFGPDGHLWYALGDGGYVPGGSEIREVLGRPQRLDNLAGKILRIAPRVGAAGYDIPPDNPFVDVASARPEVWLFGARNPWRFAFDPDGGDLWVADVGNRSFEEVDHLPAPDRGRGANLGWGHMEGTHQVFGDIAEPADHVPPVFEYPHDMGTCAIIGGAVYRGAWNPDLEGVYVFTDFCASDLRGLRLEDGAVREISLGASIPGGAPAAIDTGPDGELYVADLSGVVYRLDPA